MHRLRRTHKVDKSLWSISPVVIDCLVGKKYYSSFSPRNCELETERNWRTLQFFLDLFDWGECSISSSCCGEGGEERFLWPGERRERSSMSCRVSTIRSVLKTNRGDLMFGMLRVTCKLGSTAGALRGLERLSLSRPSLSPCR